MVGPLFLLVSQAIPSCRGFYTVVHNDLTYQSCTGFSYHVSTVFNPMFSYNYNISENCRFDSPSSLMIGFRVHGAEAFNLDHLATCGQTDRHFVCRGNRSTSFFWPRTLMMVNPTTRERLSSLKTCGINVTIDEHLLFEGNPPPDHSIFVLLCFVSIVCVFCCATHFCERNKYSRL